MYTIARRAAARALASVAITLTLTTSIWAQSERILYAFTCTNGDGGAPENGLIFDSKGNLYGTTAACGNDIGGTVFELTPNSNGTWTEQVLYSFSGFFGTGDGAEPAGQLVFDSLGNLYGTTVDGGANSGGTVFKLSPGANNTWTETVLWSFGFPDGNTPYAGVTLDASGNVYGTTTAGGPNGGGTVFELVPGSNGTWTENVLHNFGGGNDGLTPYAGVVFDTAGNLFGMTAYGGANDYGTIFELTPQSDGTWTEAIVHSFTGGADTIGSFGNLALDKAGNLYAETIYAVMKFTPSSGGKWYGKSLHDFAGASDGALAQDGLTFDDAGNLYGTTNLGGHHLGIVFELSPTADGTWTENVLHRFTGGNDGERPSLGNVTLDPMRNVYGTTTIGGAGGFGVVFEITH
jgi:uncharacterized repeat protein (TIGR03803 family)